MVCGTVSDVVFRLVVDVGARCMVVVLVLVLRRLFMTSLLLLIMNVSATMIAPVKSPSQKMTTG